MLENDAKGWHGNYSIVGRTSAERYHMIIHMDDIIEQKSKKTQHYDYFSTKEEPKMQNEDEEEERINPFLKFREELQKKMSTKNTKKKLFDSEKYKYYLERKKENQIKKELMKNCKSTYCSEPDCTRYNPKMTLIWKKTDSALVWDYPIKHATVPRKPKSREFKSFKKYAKTDNININEKNHKKLNIVVDDEGNTDNVQSKSKNTYEISNYTFNQSPSHKKQLSNISLKINTDNKSSKEKEYIFGDINNSNNNNSNIINSNAYKSKKSYNSNNSNNTINDQTKSSSTKINNTKNKKKLIDLSPKINIKDIKAPDFNKIIDRETLNKIYIEIKTTNPYINPSYKAVFPKLINTVNYSKRNFI